MSGTNQHEQVVVSGLPKEAWTMGKIRDVMLPFGPVQDVTLGKEGAAVVTFKFADDASEAVFNLDGSEVAGKMIHVRLAERVPTSAAEASLGSSRPIWKSIGASAISDEDD